MGGCYERRGAVASAAVTLDIDAHLWADSDHRTREAVERALAAKIDSAADTVRTDSNAK